MEGFYGPFNRPHATCFWGNRLTPRTSLKYQRRCWRNFSVTSVVVSITLWWNLRRILSAPEVAGATFSDSDSGQAKFLTCEISDFMPCTYAQSIKLMIRV